MIANYHTHTFRCHHAKGTDREYVEAAIEGGLKILGFSDHAPHPFLSAERETWRFCPEEIPEYFETLTALQKEYKNDIQILIGFETEYYPDYFEAFLQSIAPYPCDYLIMGQHFLKNEIEPDAWHLGDCSGMPDRLHGYVEQVLAGMKTGRFSYLAHPEYPKFDINDPFYDTEMSRLAKELSAMHIPVEINAEGFFHSRHYPNSHFIQLAAAVGCQAIVGCDAHTPERLKNHDVIAGCEQLAADAGIKLLQTVRLHNPQTGEITN